MTKESVDPSAARATFMWLAAAFAATALQGIGALLFPSLTTPPLLSFAVSFASVAGVCIAVCVAAPPLLPQALLGLLFPLGLVFMVAGMGDEAAGLAPAMIIAFALLIGGSLLGSVVGTRIEHAGHLALVAYITLVADVYSVFSTSGVTKAIVESKPLLSLLAISWPAPGAPDVYPVLGVGDVVMTALYLAAARAHDLGVRRTVVAMIVAYGAVFFALVALEKAVPALPFLSVCFVAANPRVLRIRPEDRKAALLGLVVSTVVFGVLLFR